MSSPDLDRLSEVVDLLLSVPEDRRAAGARLVCGQDGELLALVTKALSAAGQDDLLRRIRKGSPTAGLLADAEGGARTQPLSYADRPGATIGAYRLLERLGEGGFGEVYAAEQGEPIKRRVALKIIKEGMDSRAVVARFEAERQALAMMEHPNIAKVLDAGTTRAGRPFFVMEIVRGVPITAYCEENRLSPRERIELMIPVCQAIQHAHQKGIIHRDIKPSNVLVTIMDGKAVPKVIDFGIAKAIAGASTLTDKTVYTAFRQFIGTPAYMSPEQVLQSGVDVDTRSDVYALGVLMYELLSGSLPFDTDLLLKEGLERMQQVVREQDPPKPSTRVMTMDAGKRTSIAAARRLQPDKLGGTLRGEVDWMVMKAVEKDRNRRYQSASELAEDLQRFLAGDAVKASPPSGWYRARKFVRRNRVAVAIGAVAAAGLVATVIGTRIGLRREAAARAVAIDNERIAKENEAQANAEKVKAEKSAKVAEAAMQFLPDVLHGANPESNDGRKDVTVSEVLDKAVIALDQGLDARGQPLDPEVAVQVRLSTAAVYYGIGRFADGLAQARAGAALAEKVYGPETLETAEALSWVGTGLWHTGSPEEHEVIARRYLAIVRSTGNLQHPLHSIALNGLSLSYHKRGMWREALEVDKQRLTVAEQLDPPDPRQVASALHEIALNTSALGEPAAALPYIQRSVSLYETFDDKVAVSRPLTTLGNCLADLGRLEEAEAACRRSIEISDRLRGVDHPYPMYERRSLIRVLILRGKLDEAKTLSATYDRLWQAKGRTEPDMEMLDRRAMLARRLGHHADAVAIYQAAKHAAFDGPKPLVKIDAPGIGPSFAEYCGILTDLSRPAEGLAELQPVYDAISKNIGPSPTNTILRRMAAELLRAQEAIGGEASAASAAALRAQYPDLKPAAGFTPAAP